MEALSFTQKQALLRMNPLRNIPPFQSNATFLQQDVYEDEFHFYPTISTFEAHSYEKEKPGFPRNTLVPSVLGVSWRGPRRPVAQARALNSPVFVWLGNHYSFLSGP